MDNHALKNDVGIENRKIREAGLAAAREFDRVVNLFHRVMVIKEEMRKSLEKEYANLGKGAKKNLESLQILARNLDIYDQNNEKIILNLENLDAEEGIAKKTYESLLHGSHNNGLASNSMSDEKLFEEDESRKNLIQRRKEYLEELDKSFLKLDEELFSIEGLRSKFHQAENEISQKKQDAIRKKSELEENGKRILDEVRRIETQLENSNREEQLLIDEFSNLVLNVENSVDIDEAIDQILFSYLDEGKAKSGFPSGQQSIMEEG